MRVLVIIKANEESEAGIMPSEQLLNEMGKFNEELVNAGVMLAGEGLHPSSKAKRIKFSGGNRIVTDGPFAETRELIAGFWIWKVNSMEEALEWAKRIPNDPERPDVEGEIEMRPIFELEDFGAELTPEMRKLEERLRSKTEKLKQS
ncbi:MAG TPA: YciI family protein [Pyrinomonadaceae bacterium]|nr:YciI family protein [Pyrinomonadaceae bacterium]